MTQELQAPASAEPAGVLEAPTTYPSIQLQLLVPGKYQPRKTFEPGPLSELAESIKALGVMQPILIRRLPASRLQETWTDRRKGDPAPTHEIVAGERRWRAAKLAGLKAIPYLEKELTDSQVAHMALAENIQREDLHPLEEAEAYRNILDLPENADKPMADRIAALAGEVKKSTRYVYQVLQLLKLAEFPRKVFLAKLLEKSVALEISTIGNEAQQIEATRHCAGLGRKDSLEVVQHPLSQRAAADYIAANFRLLLKKAAFPIKVEFAGVGACSTCSKMSANARELYPEGATVPDTCMDPSCYGKKNTAHAQQLADAAKKAGQQVITGKDAKKILPYEGSPESAAYNSGWLTLTERMYEGQCDGKTVKQLLGKDMPKPTLVQRPDGQGYVEALPKADVMRLLKDRGLLVSVSQRKTSSQADAERKAKRIKEYRWQAAQAVLQAVANVQDAGGPAAPLTGHAGLLSQLLLPIMVQLFERLDNDSHKRVCKLLGWDVERGRFGKREQIEEHFKALPPVEINRFAVAACIASELHYAQYYHPDTDSLDAIAALLAVDLKKIQTDLDHAAKDAEKGKKAKDKAAAKKPATKAAPPAKDAAKGKPDTAKPAAPAKKAAILPPTTLQLKAPITRWMPTTEADLPRLAAGLKVRVVNEEDNLSLQLVKHAGKVGTLLNPVGKAWMVELPAEDASQVATRISFHFDELMLFAGEATELTIGMPVRFKLRLKGGTHDRKCSGRKGAIAEITKQGAVMVRCEGYKELYRADPEELEIFEGDKAPAAPTPAPAAKKAAPIKTTKAAEGKQLSLGNLEQPRTPIQPQQAWPFPPATKAGSAQ